jgi:hypothetical protein
MRPAEQGFVFGELFTYREVCGNPPSRPLRQDELRAAEILSECGPSQLMDFEEFLNSQGFTLTIRDVLDFGIPPKAGVPNEIYVLSRKRGEDMAPYVDRRWFIDQMRDKRRETGASTAKESTKAETVFWVTRMWLTLQWFFYQKIDRLPAAIADYRLTLVSESAFTETLAQGIERLGNGGRPDGESGVMWDTFWKDKGKVSTWAVRFLKVMLRAGMIENAGNKGEYRQTLVAAIDMATIAEQEIAYLIPPESEHDIDQLSVALLTGDNESPVQSSGEQHATDSPN